MAIAPKTKGQEDKEIIEDDPESLGLTRVTLCSLTGKLATDACYADDDFASREQLVAGFRKEHTVGNGAFHRSAIVVSNESRAASASGRHSNW